MIKFTYLQKNSDTQKWKKKTMKKKSILKVEWKKKTECADCWGERLTQLQRKTVPTERMDYLQQWKKYTENHLTSEAK